MCLPTDHHCSIISPQAVGIFFAGFIASSITFLIAGTVLRIYYKVLVPIDDAITVYNRS